MNMSNRKLKVIGITLITLLSLSSLAPAAKLPQQEWAPSYSPVSVADHHLVAAHDEGSYIIEVNDEVAVCRDATTAESEALTGYDQIVPLHVISPIHSEGVTPQDAGLSIILRGTQQLEN